MKVWFRLLPDGEGEPQVRYAVDTTWWGYREQDHNIMTDMDGPHVSTRDHLVFY